MKPIFTLLLPVCAVLVMGFSGCISYHSTGEPVAKTSTTVQHGSSPATTTTVVR